ncbi:hypothetical protein B296_00006100 [Ensete ventricosum]|uniref:Uncharacterized protein n=1 Tax=Ensete ventricosum TaxID=4639 RepID=A0A427AXF3_ENSVE|nr:hypothetical protein B296_00006100 [Ensete ventricosum]
MPCASVAPSIAPPPTQEEPTEVPEAHPLESGDARPKAQAGGVEGNHHYTMALIDWVHDMSRVISCLGDKITDLLSEIQELKEGPGLAVVAAVERCVADLQAKVEWLKAELVELNRQSGELQQEAEDLHRHLRDSQHQLKDAGG